MREHAWQLHFGRYFALLAGLELAHRAPSLPYALLILAAACMLAAEARTLVQMKIHPDRFGTNSP